tara:strand:+ start:307 stop:1659 length:1353 start_codon:yes stop_codon:yes gene_type:complete
MALSKEQIKEFKAAEKEAEDSYDYRSLADDIAAAGDKEWAKKIYGKAEEKAAENDDFRGLAKSVYQSLGDQKWSNDLYKKAPLTKEEIKEFKAGEKEAKDSDDFRGIAEYIADTGNKDWAKKVYEKAEKKAKDCYDFYNLASSIHEGLCDEEWTKKNYEKAEKKAEDFSEFIGIANGIAENLANKDWAKKIYLKAEIKAEDIGDFFQLAESLCEKLGDKEWAKKVYKKAEEKAKTFNDYENLVESIRNNLGDEKWLKILKQKSPKELTVCGSQLIVDFSEYSLRDVNSKNKLREVLLEYLPTYNEGDRNSGLLLPPDSVEDSDGNSVELEIKRSGELIPRPKKGKILFVSHYSYDHEIYKVSLHSDEPVTALGKKFDGETYITGYLQGGQELDYTAKDVGEHSGDMSWYLLTHIKTHPFMNDLRGIDCESETDIDEIVDEVFTFLEKGKL